MRSRLTQLVGTVLIGSAICALAALAGRLVYIHAYEGEQLLSRTNRQQRSTIPLKHRRGLIVDCRGRIISGTLLRKSVFADPKVIPDKDTAAQTVAGILDVQVGEIAPDLLAAGDRRFFVIRRGVTEDQAECIKSASIYGLGVFDEPYRVYPMNEVGAAVIGFTAPDGVGVSGIENQCETWLRGENGLKAIIRDARRKAFWLAEGGYRPPRDGLHIVLTIDAEIQSIAERELAAAIEHYRAESGIAVVLHPKTGAIFAMANWPSFDPNHYTDYGASRYRNRAITDPYEPGSVFKPFIAAAALCEDVVKLDEVFDCEMGSWQDGARVLHDHKPYGMLTFEQVLIYSSNIGMGKIGKRLGNTRLYQYIKAFGFGDKTGVDLSGEDSGIVPPFARWGSFTTTSVPMGQEVAVTALQLARAFCVFANGGKLVQPFAIRAVLAPDNRVIQDFTPPPSEEQVIPVEVANLMRERILTAVVAAKQKTQLPNHTVFGKTGTAQIPRQGGGGYEPDAYVSSFVAGAPASHPELVVAVSIRRPDKSIGYYGGDVAAPVVREILHGGLAYLQVPADKTPAPVESVALDVVPD